MTEAEWLACADPGLMLKYLRSKACGRKVRLFAVACCNRVANWLIDDRCQTALRLVERHIEGMASDEQLRITDSEAGDAYQSVMQQLGTEEGPIPLAASAVWTTTMTEQDLCESGYSFTDAAICAANQVISAVDDMAGETAAQTVIGRDIFGNPFRPVSADPRWLTSTVVNLARTMYESRDFGPMPILADALQDAGCEDADILAHCRGGGPHVRGCWVVDLILGRS